MRIEDLMPGRQDRANSGLAQVEVWRFFRPTREPVMFVENARIAPDGVRKSLEQHMGLGPADVAEMNMNVLAAARARMNEHARCSMQEAKLLFREERLDQIGAPRGSLTKVAVAMDHVDWLTFDRKGEIPAKATSLLHLHTRLSSTPIVAPDRNLVWTV